MGLLVPLPGWNQASGFRLERWRGVDFAVAPALVVCASLQAPHRDLSSRILFGGARGGRGEETHAAHPAPLEAGTLTVRRRQHDKVEGRSQVSQQ